MKTANPQIEVLLNSLANPNLATIELSLSRSLKLLAALGNPQNKLPPVIHVAGTNGKGSLLAYLTAILQAAGYRVHRYISPHLVQFNERIMLAGKDIDDAYLLELLERIEPCKNKYPVTFFEATTALAFMAFAETPADIVLLETGLGGTFDATNVIASPILTAITPVSMDHMDFLGNSLAGIANEKAGILKPCIPCVLGPQSEIPEKIIEQVANNIPCPLSRYGHEWSVKEMANGFEYHSAMQTLQLPLPSLNGAHQIYNAGTAIACCEQLKNFELTSTHIKQGLVHAHWPARMQHLTEGKLVSLLPENAELWLDGGHNEGAGEIIAAWEKVQKKPVHLICSMLANKDANGFLKPQLAHIKSFTAVPIEGEANAYPLQQLRNIAAEAGIRNSFQQNINNAIQAIVDQYKNDFIILVCGSLYLAGNILWQNGKNA